MVNQEAPSSRNRRSHSGEIAKVALWIHLGVLISLPFLGLIEIFSRYGGLLPFTDLPLPPEALNALHFGCVLPLMFYLALLVIPEPRSVNPWTHIGLFLAMLCQVALSTLLTGRGLMAFAYQAAAVELLAIGLLLPWALVRRFRDAWEKAGIAIPLTIGAISLFAMLYSSQLLTEVITWPLPGQILLFTAIVTSMRAYANGAHFGAPGVALLARQGEKSQPQVRTSALTVYIDQRVTIAVVLGGFVAYFVILGIMLNS